MKKVLIGGLILLSLGMVSCEGDCSDTIEKQLNKRNEVTVEEVRIEQLEGFIIAHEEGMVERQKKYELAEEGTEAKEKWAESIELDKAKISEYKAEIEVLKNAN